MVPVRSAGEDGLQPTDGLFMGGSADFREGDGGHVVFTG